MSTNSPGKRPLRNSTSVDFMENQGVDSIPFNNFGVGSRSLRFGMGVFLDSCAHFLWETGILWGIDIGWLIALSSGQTEGDERVVGGGISGKKLEKHGVDGDILYVDFLLED